MKIKWQTFPKLFVVLPILHYVLSMIVHAESEEHKRKKELGECGVVLYLFDVCMLTLNLKS